MVELRNSDKLIKFEFNVTAKLQEHSVNYLKSRGKDVKTSSNGTVYVVCNIDFKEEIKGFIETLADNTKKQPHTKESVNLAESICGYDYLTDLVGWHEIDNHYIFFTDKEMFDNFCKLFEL